MKELESFSNFIIIIIIIIIFSKVASSVSIEVNIQKLSLLI